MDTVRVASRESLHESGNRLLDLETGCSGFLLVTVLVDFREKLRDEVGGSVACQLKEIIEKQILVLVNHSLHAVLDITGVMKNSKPILCIWRNLEVRVASKALSQLLEELLIISFREVAHICQDQRCIIKYLI